MEITENINNFTKEISHNIRISPEDNLDAWEIAECFKKQYPDKKAVIVFSKIIQKEPLKIGVHLIMVGFKIRGKKWV